MDGKNDFILYMESCSISLILIGEVSSSNASAVHSSAFCLSAVDSSRRISFLSRITPTVKSVIANTPRIAKIGVSLEEKEHLLESDVLSIAFCISYSRS